MVPDSVENNDPGGGRGRGGRLATHLMVVEGMDCADCAAKLEKSFSKLKGVVESSVQWINARAKVVYREDEIGRDEIEYHVRSRGFRTREASRSASITFSIEKMDCPGETAVIERTLKRLDGVEKVQFFLVSREARVRFNEEKISVGRLMEAVREAGFDVSVKGTAPAPPGLFARAADFLPTIVSGALLVAGFIAGVILGLDAGKPLVGLLAGFPRSIPALGGGELMVMSFYAAGIVTGGFRIFRRGLSAVRRLVLDMNTLMSIAVAGAVLLGEWLEGATVVFLFSLARVLETWSMNRARRAIGALMELAPQEALIRRNGVEKRVPVENVGVGETVIIGPGQKIPLDGVVKSGTSAVDQSPITGEAMPVEKRSGDELYAGSINGQGALEMETVGLARDSTISRIMRMVEEARAQRAPTQAFVDRFAKYYTPAVIAAAGLVHWVPYLFFGEPFEKWFYRALVMVVIACPCALVISTPVSIVCGLANAARRGVLIKGGAYLEAVGTVRVLAFDKTGTLTTGKPEVTDVVVLGGGDEREVLKCAAAVEARSEHPIARAILARARQSGVEPVPGENFHAAPGRGAKAALGGRECFVGSHMFFHEAGNCYPGLHDRIAGMESADRTVVTVGADGELLGLITVSDRVRDGAARVIERLRSAGVRRVVMLTGDTPGTAQKVAAALGVDEYRAGLMPGDKVSAVRELLDSYGMVAMVGDGVNDAPALAASTVGIAMGAAGTDAALETADIALMADDLSQLPGTIRLGRTTRSTVKQNVVFALFTKLLFLALAGMGAATLWMAVFADMGASLIVIMNGMRLLKVRF
ncbi:MAG: heavy metal translocating P-type ATPase [bacterium]